MSIGEHRCENPFRPCPCLRKKGVITVYCCSILMLLYYSNLTYVYIIVSTAGGSARLRADPRRAADRGARPAFLFTSDDDDEMTMMMMMMMMTMTMTMTMMMTT